MYLNTWTCYTKVGDSMIIDIISTNRSDTLLDIRRVLKTYTSTYPNILDWYDDTVVPSLTPLGDGCVFAAIDRESSKLAGFIILKSTDTEKKIRHITVLPEYRGNHIGSRLMLKAFEYLGTTTPKITSSEDTVDILTPLLSKYKFDLTDIVKSIYIEGKYEYIFNGDK